MKAKKIDWKKDNLKHLSDHGLSVEFDAVKTQFLRGLKDGKTRIQAGKSYAEIETVGRVSRVHFSDAIGHRGSSFSIHYFSQDEGLSFSVHDEETRRVLEVAIFGDWQTFEWWEVKKRTGLTVLQTGNGADLDKLREWSRKNAWALLGENGFRSQAIAKSVAGFESVVQSAKSDLRAANDRHERATGYDYPAAFGRIRGETESILNGIRGRKEAIEEDIAMVRTTLASDETVFRFLASRFETSYGGRSEAEKAFAAFGAQPDRVEIWTEEEELCYVPAPFFPGTVASFSLAYQKANYVVRRDGIGGLALSSTIACPFDEATALAWLKGESPAPSTRYGVVSRVETHDGYGHAVTLVKCGCHYIDAGKDLGEPFAELLAPTHTVTVQPATPSLALTVETRNEFLTRCETVAQARLDALEAEKLEALANYASKKAELEKQRVNRPAFLESLAGDIMEKKRALDDAETELGKAKTRYPGNTDANQIGLNVLNAQTLKCL